MLFNHTGEYVCECGKQFTTAQSFNGHKSHCIVHLTAAGKVSNYYQRQAYASQCANAERRSRAAAVRLLKKQQWIEEKHVCAYCGKLMTEKYGSGKFCSRACANSHTYTEEVKQRMSLSANSTAKKAYLSSLPKRTCPVCGREHQSLIRYRGACSAECFDILLTKKAAILLEQDKTSTAQEYANISADLFAYRAKCLESEQQLLSSLDDDNKLRSRYYNKCANARLEGINCQLTLHEYCLLLAYAGLHSSDLGFRPGAKKFVLARFNDVGDYVFGNCRFITQAENMKEHPKTLETYKNLLQYNSKLWN